MLNHAEPVGTLQAFPESFCFDLGSKSSGPVRIKCHLVGLNNVTIVYRHWFDSLRTGHFRADDNTVLSGFGILVLFLEWFATFNVECIVLGT
jgi:hypothetical protein